MVQCEHCVCRVSGGCETMGMNTDATIRLRKSGDINLVPILPSRNAVSPRVAYEHDTIHSEKVGLLVFPDSRTLNNY